MARIATILLPLLALAGCAHQRVLRGGETITYRAIATDFCLTCASYTVTLGPDGQGIFTGETNTAVLGDRRFRADSAAVHAFTERLARYRPETELLMTPNHPSCPTPATDQNSIDISWQPADAPPSHLAFYEGCAVAKQPRMVSDLDTAPALLPIADLVGH